MATVSIKVQLFGTPGIVDANNRLIPLRISKGVGVLSYLLLESEQQHARGVIASLLWGDSDQARSRRSLSQTLKRMNDELVAASDHPSLDVIVGSRSVLGIVENSVECDAVRFEQLLHETETHKHNALQTCSQCHVLLREAVALADCPLLQGLDAGSGADQFEEWLLLKRESVHERRMAALTQLADVALKEANFVDAAQYARQQLASEPWRESAHRQLISALIGNNDVTAALVQFGVCKSVLWDELAVEPSKATSALIMNHDTQPDHKVAQAAPTSRTVDASEPQLALARNNLPGALVPIFGREIELDDLLEKVLYPESRIVTILGQGGIGKTTLALETGRELLRVENSRLEGIYFVPLVGIDSAELVPDAIASAVGLTVNPSDSAGTTVSDFFSDKAAVLILDNFEHLLAATDWLIYLLEQTPKLQLLITSRERLALMSEDIYQVDGLPVPPLSAEMTQASAFAATRLFVDRAKRQHPHFRLSPDSWEAIRTICRHLGGHPLGIELTTTLLGEMTLPDIAVSVAETVDYLETDLKDIAPHQRSMRTVLEQSWDRMDVQSQQILAALSVMRGSFGSAAARAVTTATPLVLRRLRHKSLLRSTAPGRYDMHELVRQFSAEKLASQPEALTNAGIKHATHYLEFLSVYQPENPKAHRPTILAEKDNIYAAWRSAIANQQTELLFAALTPFTILHDDTWGSRQGLRYVRILKQHLETITLAQRSERQRQLYLHTLFHEGELMIGYSAYASAKPILEHAISLLDENEESATSAAAYRNLGRISLHHGDSTTALALFERALAITQRGGFQAIEGAVLREIGSVHRQRGNYQRYVDYVEKALTIFKQLGDEMKSQSLMSWLGYAQLDVGRYWRGYSDLQEADKLNEVTGSAYQLAGIDSTLGRAEALLGEYDHAIVRHQRAIPQLHAIDANWRIVMVYIEMSLPLLRLARIDELLQFLETATEMANANNMQELLARIRLAEGYAMMDAGRLNESREAFREAGERMDALGRSIGVLEARINLTLLALWDGKLDEAASLASGFLSVVADEPLHGAYERERLYLTGHHIADALDSPLASAIDTQQKVFVESVISEIDDVEVRERYVGSLPTLATITVGLDRHRVDESTG